MKVYGHQNSDEVVSWIGSSNPFPLKRIQSEKCIDWCRILVRYLIFYDAVMQKVIFKFLYLIRKANNYNIIDSRTTHFSSS